MSFQKINELPSFIEERFQKKDFVPATNIAVAMGRVSLKKNKLKGNSDLAQIEHYTDYAEENDLKIIKTWDVAETASKHEKRKNFFELIDFVEESQKTAMPVSHVLFAYTSRGSRNKKSKRMLEELIELGVVVHFTQDNLVLTSELDLGQKLSWEVKASKDEEDVEKLQKHVWDGIKKRLQKGLFPGKAPFGFKNQRIEELDDLSIFIFNGVAADFMRSAFELFATDLFGECELKRRLDSMYPTLNKTPNSERFSELLRNPFYYGQFEYMGQMFNGHVEYHPRLISYPLWKRVQDILASRKNSKVIDRCHPYLGMIKCGGRILDDSGSETEAKCNCYLTAEEKRKPQKDGSTRKHYYYHCTQRLRRCSQRSPKFLEQNGREKINYKEKEVEELFRQIVAPLSFPREQVEWMREMLLQHHREACASERKGRDGLKTRYEMLFRYQEKAYEDKLGGKISEEEWKKRNENWQTERVQIETQLKSSAVQFDERLGNGVALIELLEGTENTWKNASQETKARIIKLLVIEPSFRNGSIEFTYKKPFDLLAKVQSKEIWWTRTESNR